MVDCESLREIETRIDWACHDGMKEDEKDTLYHIPAIYQPLRMYVSIIFRGQLSQSESTVPTSVGFHVDTGYQYVDEMCFIPVS